jgi:hypothetical protein
VGKLTKHSAHPTRRVYLTKMTLDYGWVEDVGRVRRVIKAGGGVAKSREALWGHTQSLMSREDRTESSSLK